MQRKRSIDWEFPNAKQSDCMKDSDLLAAFRNLGDLTGTVSDVLDQLGIAGAVPASILRPSEPRARIVGPALTVLNRARKESVPEAVASKKSGLGEINAHRIAKQGDVLVIQGVPNVSSLGGTSATVGKRQGQIGAVVDGGVRDVDHSRGIGYPIWSSSVTPITGKWRVQTEGVNVPVVIAGVTVQPGDFVLADECGVCFIPRARAAEVLAIAQRWTAWEEDRLKKLDAGIPLEEFVKLKRPE
jgi:4-hydroxy-4-methyl-2-oxoglutarate aldolase